MLGTDVIVQLADGGSSASLVWLPEVDTNWWRRLLRLDVRGVKPIALTGKECRDLGGTTEKDTTCPELSSTPDSTGSLKYRCKVPGGGSACIDEVG
jgi:hypothetical protein